MPHDGEKPTSIWKKEISFKRKPREEGAASTEAESTSVWKKEVSFGRKRKDAVEPEPAFEPEPEPELPLVDLPLPVAEAPTAEAPAPPIEHDWLTQPLDEVSEPPEPAAAEEVTVERPPLHVLAEPEPAPAPDPAPAFEPAPAPDPVPDPVLPPIAAAPEVAPPSYDDLFDLNLDALDADAPELVAEPEPEAEPALAVEADAAAVPFYKRELSFGRKRAKEPKPAKEPKARKAPKERKPKAEKPQADGANVPFYKRELSFGRGTKAPAEPKPAKEPRAAKEPKAPKPRRELPKLRLPSLQLPSRPAPAGAAGAKKVVGLKIGSSQLAAARVQNGGTPELVQAVREPLEPGIVVGGELRDPDALALALKDFFKRHKLPRRGVRLGIANNRIGVRTFDVAGIDDPKQLDNAVKFRAQEVLPIPIEEAVLDYQVLSEFTNEEGQPVRRVLLVVAYRELVDRYVLACRKAGIQIVGIDLEAFALLRALAEPRPAAAGPDQGALVAVSVGHERSTFAVSDGRVCEFTRVLEWGGWAMNVSIARALDLAPSEAEPIKRALSFAGAEELPEGLATEQLETAREAARKQLQSFARELVSSLQFYQNQPGSLGIAEIVVTGGTTHLPGFGAELERLIGVPVRVGDPLSRVKVSKKVREREQVGSLAVAIGLGIED